MRAFWRWVVVLVLAGLALELFFVLRVGLAASVAPQSTTFQRSEAWRIFREKDRAHWAQHWVPYEQLSNNLKRAVIASEDDDFVYHDGIDWEAVEKAWEKNAKAQELAAKAQLRAGARLRASAQPVAQRAPKIVGGSTITQQLAKNLLLSGERTMLRKGQEFVLTYLLELLLTKERILEIYLNSIEWGEGVFGAEAAAQHYWHKHASELTAYEAARLAVMLPRPRYFEKVPNSGYLSNRAMTIVARMRHAELP
ncbi:transglycosylase domain-containing protein [Ramlibacter sp. MMS24-I3-19]|uniref:transglycosylase domain-containing protein n=1 Tax=Ramlibacter sp. MMS24-I3-19 TaxID=3416606 RepID=UPI003D060156